MESARDQEAAASLARPIRVLYTIGNLQMGGTEAHLVQLMTRISRAKVEPRLLMLNNVNDLMPESLAREVRPVLLDVGPGVRGTIQAMTRLRRAIREVSPDVVQAYGYPADCLTAACGVNLRGVRLITTRRGNEVRPRRHQYYRWTNRLVQKVVCVSQASARHSRETEALGSEKTLVIPNGIDLTRYRAPDRVSGRIRVMGSVQRLREIKGIDLLLDAYSMLPEDRPVLRIAGPADTAYGEALVARHRDTPGLEFLGEVKDIPSFLSDLDLFVLPSRSEGMSNALLEAMAMALPVVATAVGGNPEVLADGSVGMLVEPTAESIAAGMRALIQDPARALEFGRLARARVEQEYDIDVMVRRYEDLYAQLVAEPS